LAAKPPAPLVPAPKRGEIWTAELGDPPRRHWVLVVSLDSRNQSQRVDSVLIVPFGSMGVEGPTVLRLESGETGLPAASFLKGHFITTLPKARLGERQPRPLSGSRMRQVCELLRRAFDPDAPYDPPKGQRPSQS
jgi:mRNA-degrading endonuclease toxin of MazEF toxin-antitoxin module